MFEIKMKKMYAVRIYNQHETRTVRFYKEQEAREYAKSYNSKNWKAKYIGSTMVK